MSNILITGSTGFIGSHILKKFNAKNKIYLILRNNNRSKKKIISNKNIKVISYNKYHDLNKKLKNITANTIIHCATHYVKNHNVKDIEKLTQSNILFGNIILENLTNMKTKKFINFSTVWEDYDSIRDNSLNLYSAYKKGFSFLTDYYKKLKKDVKFYNIMISDTFGENDKRLKIINVLKNNYNKKKITKIVSKNLFINLLNVNDIVDAINILLKTNLKSGKYVLKNNITHKIGDIIKSFNNANNRKIRVKWLSQKIIKEKIYPYQPLLGWRPKQSKIIDIINIIKT